MRQLRNWLPWICGVIVVSGVLATLDVLGPPLSGWPSYLVLCTLSAILILAAWRLVLPQDGPRWLLVAICVAITIRVALGVSLTYALPTIGYDNRHQRAGFFFPDAFLRDREALKLADSEQPLVSAFSGEEHGDQYGGLMFVIATIYRVLSPDVHRQMLVLVLTATASALAVLFTWAFTNIAFNSKVATIAAWIVAVYPEAVLLGSSQMREPFLIMGIAMTLYGYARAREGFFRIGLMTILGGVVLTLFFSPPFGVLTLGIAGTLWLWERRVDFRRLSWGVVLFFIIALLAVYLTVQGWSGIEHSPAGRVGELLNWWLSVGARYELSKLVEASGMVQFLVSQTPEWAHLPMATGNGLVQPFLPAALMDNTGTLFARAIAIWRAVGWFILLPILIYALFAAFRRAGLRSLQAYLALLVWGTALLVSYRTAGDQWDNVRYRVVFLAAQAALAGWAWTHARRTSSPWLRRVTIIVGVATLLFIQWYAGRYYKTPSLSLFTTIGILGVFFVSYLIGAVSLDVWRGRQSPRLTGGNSEV